VALPILRRRDPQPTSARVDWTLLLFFTGLIIVTGALRETGLVALAWRALAPALTLAHPAGLAAFTGVILAGSNLVSNVPMVILTGPYLELLGDPDLGYTLLAYVTTVAGNLTLVGSVANIIVAEGARAPTTTSASSSTSASASPRRSSRSSSACRCSRCGRRSCCDRADARARAPEYAACHAH
jgi:Na+/H+ antiporter NhaD/arsenite permease-like protein